MQQSTVTLIVAGLGIADELSTERRDAGGSDVPLCRAAGERHCRAERVSADDTAADDSGHGEVAAVDCGAGSNHA